MIEDESPSIRLSSNQCQLMKYRLAELREICGKAGEWENLTRQPVISSRFVGTSHERSKQLR